jgi:hypothetical protein
LHKRTDGDRKLFMPSTKDVLRLMRQIPFDWERALPAWSHDGWTTAARLEAVQTHLLAMESMGLVVRQGHSSWQLPSQRDRQHHVLHRSEHPMMLLEPMGDAPELPPLRPSAVGQDGGGEGGRGEGRGGDGGRGRGDGNGGDGDAGNVDGQGPGGGVGEVLAHPVLFALPRAEFDSLLDNLFNGPGSP